MKNNRILSLLLALCLCISMVTTVHAAGTVLTVEAPETLPAVGETFSVTVSVSGNPGLGAVQFTLGFNKSVVECTDASLGTMLKGAIVGGTNPTAQSGAKAAAVASSVFSGDGILVQYTFKVLKAGEPAFYLKDIVLTKPDKANVEPTVQISGTAVPTQPVKPEQGGAAAQPETPEETENEVALPQTFTDVPDTYWASAQIERAAAMGLISGYADGSFRPGNQVTRAQFVTMLWRMAGKPAPTKAAAFADIAGLNAEFKSAIAWASENGYVNGVTATAFHPNATITRQQAMVILFRYNGGVSGMELMLSGIYDSQFTDSATIGAFAKSGVYWAVYNGIVNGVTSTTIVPHGTATRAQIAVILLRYADKF